MDGRTRRWFGAAALAAACMHLAPAAYAQTTPPRQAPSGVNVSDGFYAAAGAVAGATVAGVRAMGRAVKDLVTPGKPAEELEGFRDGMVVVVHYPSARSAPVSLRGDDEDDDPIQAEGIVSRVNRGRGEVTVRFDSRTSETFQLAAPSAAAGQGAGSPVDPSAVTIDYTDETGQRVAHTFRKKT